MHIHTLRADLEPSGRQWRSCFHARFYKNVALLQVTRCQAQVLELEQPTQVLDGPISKDACTLQDVILSGEKVGERTGLRLAKVLLELLAQRHSSMYVSTVLSAATPY